MANRKAKPPSPAPAAGVTETIAVRARARRVTQRAIVEVGIHSYVAPRNDLAPRPRFETRALDRFRPAERQVRRRDARARSD